MSKRLLEAVEFKLNKQTASTAKARLRVKARRFNKNHAWNFSKHGLLINLSISLSLSEDINAQIVLLCVTNASMKGNSRHDADSVGDIALKNENKTSNACFAWNSLRLQKGSQHFILPPNETFNWKYVTKPQSHLTPHTRRHKNGRIHRPRKTSTIKQLAFLLINNSYLDCGIYSNKASIDDEGTRLLIIILRLVISLFLFMKRRRRRSTERETDKLTPRSVSQSLGPPPTCEPDATNSTHDDSGAKSLVLSVIE